MIWERFVRHVGVIPNVGGIVIPNRLTKPYNPGEPIVPDVQVQRV